MGEVLGSVCLLSAHFSGGRGRRKGVLDISLHEEASTDNFDFRPRLPIDGRLATEDSVDR